ncbi:hypothetical protein HPB48_018926 [Haemaphysalis longicornis]|uniref:Uncharacterized protein n=1 Tax=Haemaphysalis longicornis TaxID=44386 RepID=A0A9J6GH72_HAELO|nr:hypothetical protein HPB48_018926 [Haemaphysalis longicornis]
MQPAGSAEPPGLPNPPATHLGSMAAAAPGALGLPSTSDAPQRLEMATAMEVSDEPYHEDEDLTPQATIVDRSTGRTVAAVPGETLAADDPPAGCCRVDASPPTPQPSS